MAGYTCACGFTSEKATVFFGHLQSFGTNAGSLHYLVSTSGRSRSGEPSAAAAGTTPSSVPASSQPDSSKRITYHQPAYPHMDTLPLRRQPPSGHASATPSTAASQDVAAAADANSGHGRASDRSASRSQSPQATLRPRTRSQTRAATGTATGSGSVPHYADFLTSPAATGPSASDNVRLSYATRIPTPSTGSPRARGDDAPAAVQTPKHAPGGLPVSTRVQSDKLSDDKHAHDAAAAAPAPAPAAVAAVARSFEANAAPSNSAEVHTVDANPVDTQLLPASAKKLLLQMSAAGMLQAGSAWAQSALASSGLSLPGSGGGAAAAPQGPAERATLAGEVNAASATLQLQLCAHAVAETERWMLHVLSWRDRTLTVKCLVGGLYGILCIRALVQYAAAVHLMSLLLFGLLLLACYNAVVSALWSPSSDTSGQGSSQAQHSSYWYAAGTQPSPFHIAPGSSSGATSKSDSTLRSHALAPSAPRSLQLRVPDRVVTLGRHATVAAAPFLVAAGSLLVRLASVGPRSRFVFTAAVLWMLLLLGESGWVSQWSQCMLAYVAAFVGAPALSRWGHMVDRGVVNALALGPWLLEPEVRGKLGSASVASLCVYVCFSGAWVVRVTAALGAGALVFGAQLQGKPTQQ